MDLVLSVLDPAPIFEGRTARDALMDMRELARLTENLGYRAYWVQEHHNTPCFASVAPEVLIADLAARTSRIMLGSGGIMLPNYSPLKVAEQALTLSALAPGRIEIGLGRATGADPRASAALLGPGPSSFPSMLQLLIDWLADASGEAPLAAGHRAHGIAARPSAARPDLWMLSSSAESAAFAGAMGLKLAFADFLSPGGAQQAIQLYKRAFQASLLCPRPHAAVAYVALAGQSTEEARREAAPGAAWNVMRAAGKFVEFPTRDVAEAILRRVPADDVAAARSRAIVGSADEVAATLRLRAEESSADEIFILTIAERLETRAASYRLISEAMQRAAPTGFKPAVVR